MRDNRFYREPAKPFPTAAFRQVRAYVACLDPKHALVDRPALEEVNRYLASIAPRHCPHGTVLELDCRSCHREHLEATA